METTIVLRDVTADNWEDVVDLELESGQRDFVADNAYSLAESKFNPYAVPRAVYAGAQLVGFAMYESLGDEDRPNDYAITRLMIDRRFQGKGYGRQTLQLVINEIRKDALLNRVVVCYTPENDVSRQLYASFGFVEAGLDEDGELQAELKL